MYVEKWAYLAGYIDADGCISLTKDSCKANSVSCSLSISSINRLVLIWIYGLTGHGKVTEVKYYDAQKDWNRRHHRQQWQWRTSNNGMRYVLPHVFPYLKVKKRQARLVMEYLDMARRRRGYKITDDDRKRKKEIIAEMKVINHRGKKIVSE